MDNRLASDGLDVLSCPVEKNPREVPLMEERAPLDEALLKKLNRLNEFWPIHRRDLNYMIYFCLGVIALTFFNLDILNRVAGSPVVKVIDIFGLLVLFIVPIWAYYERTQGDRMQQVLWRIDEGGYDPDDIRLMESLREAGDFTAVAEKGYPFILMMGGMGIITLNVVAYIVYGPAPV
jgi:hypothetical protein